MNLAERYDYFPSSWSKLAISSSIAFLAYHRHSLSLSGLVAAIPVGLLAFQAAHPLFPAVLLFFFFSSSFLTKFRKDVKAQLVIEPPLAKRGRSAIQVFSNSLSGCLCCALFIYANSPHFLHQQQQQQQQQQDKLLLMSLWGYFAHYACCCADTWASEIGILSWSKPHLLNGKQVPPGSNGGITWLGLCASLMAGKVLGLLFALSLKIWPIPAMGKIVFWKVGAIGAVLGLYGSLIDSLLGATLQPTWVLKTGPNKMPQVVEMKIPGARRLHGKDCLDNHQVNLVASCITTATAVFIAWLY